MRLFLYELKKIWNWRVLVLIAGFAALIWFSILRGNMETYRTLSDYGVQFGPYQREMFDKYGPTLEPEELADYDIPGKIAMLETELDAWIAKDPLFAEQGISTYAQYDSFRSQDRESMNEKERAAFDEKTMQMDMKLSMDEHWNDPKKQFVSPYIRMTMLASLNGTYTEYERDIGHSLMDEKRPVVVQAAEQVLAKQNNSLIQSSLKGAVSFYSTIVGVSVILATLLLVSPSLTRDRARGLHLLQYSSKTGRRILWIQGAAVVVSVCVFAFAAIAISAAAPIRAGMGDYLDASMLFLSYGSLSFLYEITFGQYVLLLAGMIVLLSMAAAGFAFVLAKFSANIMAAVLKIVPLGLAFWVLYLSVIGDAFEPHDLLFDRILRGRAVMPEVMLCAALGAIGLLAAAIVVAREKNKDIG